MVKSLRTAVVSPDADYNQFSNFRPVSKIIEKAVAVQLTNYIMNYHMDEMFQSWYKVVHSTVISYVLLITMIL